MSGGPQQNPAKARRAEVLLSIVVFVWAVNYPVAKYGLMGLNPFIFNAIRFFVATAVIGALLLRRSHWVPVKRSDWPKLLLAGILGSVIYQVAFVIGLSMTTAGNVSVLIATSPLWTIILNSRLNGEKIHGEMWLGMVISFLGIVLIVTGSGARLAMGGNDMIGDLIILAGAALWGMTTALQRPLLVRYPAGQTTFILVAVGGVGLSLLAIPFLPSMDWQAVHWTYYGSAFMSGLFSIGIANVVWSYGVQQIGPGRTANFNNLVPVLAFIVSWLTLNERLATVQFIGAGVTILGVWIARR
jgi:O-acetylserine/cysteine efflux transporter